MVHNTLIIIIFLQFKIKVTGIKISNMAVHFPSVLGLSVHADLEIHRHSMSIHFQEMRQCPSCFYSLESVHTIGIH